MLEFITTHWSSILVVVLFIALIVILALKGKKKIIYRILYALVTEAEELYGSGTGSLKFAYVLEKLYAMLPAVVKIFITYDTMAEWIESVLVEAKERWKEMAFDGGEETVEGE